MNISHIRAFLAVVDTGSFSAAARVLGVSQPAVTMQIRSLEEDLGVVLLDRRYRKIDLTEAGAELLGRARRIVGEVEAARTSIVEMQGTVSGRLSIAASTTPGDYVVPALLGEFMRAYPSVTLSISVGDSSDVVAAVENGAADVGITGVRGEARVEYDEIGRDELILIAHPDRSVAPRRGEVRLADLAAEPWIMRERGSGTRSVTESVLADAGVDVDGLNVVVELGSGEAIVGAVEGDLGIAMVSEHVAAKSLRLGTVKKIELARKVVRPFFIVLPKGTPTRAALAFAAHLHKRLDG